MLKSWFVELPSGPVLSMFEWWPLGLNVPTLGDPGFETKKYLEKIFKNLLLQNSNAQMHKIWYDADLNEVCPGFKTALQQVGWV